MSGELKRLERLAEDQRCAAAVVEMDHLRVALNLLERANDVIGMYQYKLNATSWNTWLRDYAKAKEADNA